MDVRHYMTRNPVTVSPTDSLRKAWLLMHQAHLHRLPVIEDNRVIGIVTDRDIWERRPAGLSNTSDADSDYLMDRLRVMGVMTLHPVTVSASTEILEAARLLRSNRLGTLLVVERGELVGILTKGDLVDGLMKAATNLVPAEEQPVSSSQS